MWLFFRCHSYSDSVGEVSFMGSYTRYLQICISMTISHIESLGLEIIQHVVLSVAKNVHISTVVSPIWAHQTTIMLRNLISGLAFPRCFCRKRKVWISIALLLGCHRPILGVLFKSNHTTSIKRLIALVSELTI